MKYQNGKKNRNFKAKEIKGDPNNIIYKLEIAWTGQIQLKLR